MTKTITPADRDKQLAEEGMLYGAVALKQRQREQLQADVDAFLAAGGAVELVDPEARREAPGFNNYGPLSSEEEE